MIFSAKEAPVDLAPYRVVVVDQKDQFAAIDGERPLAAEADVLGTDAAYVMLTQMTGFPKGAVMSHANLLNFIRWARSGIFDHIGGAFFTQCKSVVLRQLGF